MDSAVVSPDGSRLFVLRTLAVNAPPDNPVPF